MTPKSGSVAATSDAADSGLEQKTAGAVAEATDLGQSRSDERAGEGASKLDREQGEPGADPENAGHFARVHTRRVD